VTLKDLPPFVSQAVIASEDRRFYSHMGFDIWGLGRAAWVNVQSGRVVQGGSTITQQLAKNLFLKPERTFTRKMQEALLAVYLEASFSKDDIIALYLNRVYFNKPASHLTLIESAILAGLLKAPTRYSPMNGPELAEERSRLVLQAMVDTGFISEALRDDALHTQPKFATSVAVQGNQYFTDWVMEQLPDLAGESKSDLVVETTLDLNMQRAAEDAMLRTLRARTPAQIQGALFAMTTDGAVRAMVGGRSYSQSVFNRATQARRQPGSAFKPFVYLTALESGMTPSSLVIDEPVTYRGWTPENFKPGNEGEMTLTQALAKSVNTIAVQLCLKLGPESVVQSARRMGITSDLAAVPSLALGTSEVTLAELVSAYAPFANGGRGAIAHGVKRIRTIEGEILYERAGSGLGRLISAENAGAMNRMLSEAVRSGTGRSSALAHRPSAGKTGTTQESKDAWFIGYTRQIVAGVWLGSDEGLPMTKDVTGGTLPTLIWKTFMERATAGQQVLALPGTDIVDQAQSDTKNFDEVLAGVLKEPAAPAQHN
jgi:penicillin-binding protein 1A